MQPKIFDIHSHLNFPDFDKDREDVITRMKEEGIFSIVVGTDRETSEFAIDIAEKHENLFAAVGLHPTDKESEQFDIKYYRELAKHHKVVAIGECGLDYFRIKNQESRIRQLEIFKKQIELALDVNKPLMIHCRDAHNELLEILSTFYSQHSTCHNGNIHFFSGTKEEAQKYFDLGFTVSFAGVITFPPSPRLRRTSTNAYDEVIKSAPLEKIMIETDAPFVAPVPYRGQRNEPLYVKEVAKKIAAIRDISYDEVIEQTTKNALKFFNINPNRV